MSDGALGGKTIAFLTANEGVEQVELTTQWQAVEQAHGTPRLVAPKRGTVQMFQHLDKGDTMAVDTEVSQARAEDFDALVLPGGVANPDQLRTIPEAVEFAAQFVRAGKPVAVICHGPWTLVEADVVRGRRLTSWPSLRTDIRNAGGEWVDDTVVVCSNGPGVIVSSRQPDDLPAFCQTAVEAFAGTLDTAQQQRSA